MLTQEQADELRLRYSNGNQDRAFARLLEFLTEAPATPAPAPAPDPATLTQ